MSVPSQMTKQRAELLRRIMNVNSPSEFLSIQEVVAECICELEQGEPKPTDGEKISHHINMDDGLFAPPVIWPIDLEHRQAILEGDIVIAHLVHAQAFIRDGLGEPVIELHASEEYPIHVRLDGKTYPLARRLVYDVLYGFETVECCVHGIVDFAQRCIDETLKQFRATFRSYLSLDQISHSATHPSLLGADLPTLG